MTVRVAPVLFCSVPDSRRGVPCGELPAGVAVCGLVGRRASFLA
jgi:hypothetical protein